MTTKPNQPAPPADQPENPTAPAETVEAEIVGGELARAGGIPTTLAEIADAKDGGRAIMEARLQVWETARLGGIRMTSEGDWLLFRAVDPDGVTRITAFLQDSGCQRVRPILGIDCTPAAKGFERIEAEDGEFAYSIEGNGFCQLTGQTIKSAQGLRYSTDDFCKGLTPIMKEMRVRQAARANLDGGITRKLSGLSSVPVEELERSWKGTGKQWQRCAKGKGFGTRRDREGGVSERAGEAAAVSGVPTDQPHCPSCGGGMRFKAEGKYGPWWSCKNYPNCKGTVDHEKWLTGRRDAPPAPAREAGSDDK